MYIYIFSLLLMVHTSIPMVVTCIDSTPGTNGFDFTLMSVLIVDEYGKEFPLVHCTTNRENQIFYFRAVKRRNGVVTPAYKIYALAEDFYTA